MEIMQPHRKMFLMLYAIIMALFIEYLLGASKKLGPFYGTLIFTTLKQLSADLENLGYVLA